MRTEKKILIVGASILQKPAVVRAKQLGCSVAVADYDPNAAAIPYADRYYNVSTVDAEGVCRAAKDFGADGIMTIATDMPMRSVAYTAKKLGLTGISEETAVRATDKGEMIRAFEAHGVAHPWYRILPDPSAIGGIKETLTYPCVSKPTDNSGSRGVTLIRSEEELAPALNYSRENGRKGGVIIEEYLTGSEVSVEVIVYKGVPHVLQITDKITTGAPHFVEMGHTQPSRLPASDREKIASLACAAVRAVGIDNGPAHVEIMLTANGPKMIELGARMGGDCIASHLVPLSTGIDMIGAALSIALGEEPDLSRRFDRGSAIRYLDPPAGTVLKVEGIEEARKIAGVKEVNVQAGPGGRIGEISSSVSRAGFVIAEGKDAQEAAAIAEKAAGTVRFTTARQ
ncbi:MAG: ATP-grasp domain-containing protein [Clostridia bacterium]|nr:ATP-grasp domain-containing protein [Clostridia bacterium]